MTCNLLPEETHPWQPCSPWSPCPSLAHRSPSSPSSPVSAASKPDKGLQAFTSFTAVQNISELERASWTNRPCTLEKWWLEKPKTSKASKAAGRSTRAAHCSSMFFSICWSALHALMASLPMLLYIRAFWKVCVCVNEAFRTPNNLMILMYMVYTRSKKSKISQ